MAALFLEIFSNYADHLSANGAGVNHELLLTKEALEELKEFAKSQDDYWEEHNKAVELEERRVDSMKPPGLKSSEDSLKEQISKKIFYHTPLLPLLLSENPSFMFQGFNFKIKITNTV
jgi:hypothetical protein